MLRLYNTLTRKIEDFTPLKPPIVTYYSCGPTVYDFAHIGHARTFVFADIVHRVLLLNDYQVKRVMNITDVGHLTSDADTGEDKMEKGAARENKTVWDIAKFYADDFFTMLAALNIQKPETVCRATDHISSMIQIIEVLERKGFVYRIADGMYFDTTKFPSYGQLSGMTLDELQKHLKAGARVEMVAGKKNLTDFALWKFSYPNGRSFNPTLDDIARQRQMEWDSPWGRGFPGWHIECSAMSMEFLGETLDIHTGAVDHIPVHHTNEIAQSETATGKPFVRFWLHGEHLLIDGQKMSKSLGNYWRIKDIVEKGFSPLALRYLFFTAGYRKQLNFTWKSLEGAQRAWEGLKFQISSRFNRDQMSNAKSKENADTDRQNEYQTKFIGALNDDLHTAQALAVLWEGIKSDLSNDEKYQLVGYAEQVLRLDLLPTPIQHKEEAIPADVTALVEERVRLRKEKKWKDSDEVRAKIEKKGYTVKDTSSGTQVMKQ